MTHHIKIKAHLNHLITSRGLSFVFLNTISHVTKAFCVFSKPASYSGHTGISHLIIPVFLK